MARYKTKKQKKKIAKKATQVKVKPSSIKADSTLGVSELKISTKNKIQATVFSNSQVKLLYRDLFKTLVVTIIVFTVLLSIFIYMR